MTDLPATANGDKAEQNVLETIRDKACSHLKELVGKSRESGKYMFRRNPNRYRQRVSKYWQKFNRNSGKDDEVAE